MHTYSNSGAGAAIPSAAVIPVVNGAGLAHRKLTKTQLAVLAVSVDDDSVRFKPSLTQLATLFGVSVTYILQARKLGMLQRHAIMKGWEDRAFADLVPPRQSTPPAITDAQISDNDLEQMIRAVGLERALAAAVTVESA